MEKYIYGFKYEKTEMNSISPLNILTPQNR